MITAQSFRSLVWLGTVLFIGLAFYVWWPSTKNLTGYSLFPIFGLVAFTLMWTHYVAGAARQYLGLPGNTLKTHFKITSYVVLFCILAHPFLFYLQLYVDGFGLPYQAVPKVYPQMLQQIAVLTGVIALLCFLAFELYRFFKERSWWKYVEWANIAAMALVLWHGFTLGGELRQPWFQIVWAFYAVTFAVSVAYSGYRKRRNNHGREEQL